MQQLIDLRTTQVLHEFAGFHILRDLRQVAIRFQLLVDVYDMLQLLKEPAVNLCQLVNLFDSIADLQRLRHHKDTHVGRFME